ncbi:MAG: lamin tail domain-containing protein [Pirellulales bacterium]|nr:lamin tail domain-containing protein [Pirellulales bacterium]
MRRSWSDRPLVFGSRDSRKRDARQKKSLRPSRLTLQLLEPRLVLDAGPLVISEFMAINDDTLADAEGDYEDWIEIHNPTDAAVSLDGWYLTDDPDDLTQWQFPGVSLDPHDYLIVFASGKDPAPGGELHASFKIDGDGEYLALVRSDGTTIADQYAPEFPQQMEDVSYGIGNLTLIGDTLIDEGEAVRVLVPQDGGLGLSWTEPGFDDSLWITGDAGVGYDTDTGGQVFAAKINFQPAASPVPDGYEPDSGLVFGDRGNGYAYGWTRYVDETRDRGQHADQRYDTLDHMQKAATPDTWEITVPNGNYDVFLVCGDPSFTDQVNTMDVEGTVFADPDGEDNFDEYSGTVTVADGRLTVTPAPGASNAKIAFIEISSADPPGYHALINTDVEAEMLGHQTSAYVRQTFPLADVPAYTSMTLRMKYDDGFVAYLNGQQIAERNVQLPLTYDAHASTSHPDEQAIVFEDIDVSAFIDALVVGTNVLAIHGLNSSATSTDFLILPELMASATVAYGEQYFTDPTPGVQNTEGALGRVTDTQFSVDRGFFDAPFQVAIGTETDGVEIRYTTDGSEPTATTGQVYAGPISVSTTTTLRAAAYKPGFISTNVDTQTYIFLDDVLQQDGAGLPDNWGHDGADYAMDPDVVNSLAYRDTIEDDMKAIPTLSLVMDQDDWFGGGGQGIYISGKGIERSASAELIYPDGTEGFQINSAVQIQGGTSTNRWKVDKLSMRVKFKEPYGPTKLNFPLYGDTTVESFDTFLVDAMMNNNWLHPDAGQQARGQYTRDQYVSDIQNAMGGYGTHGFYVHLYLNGLYWGLYWIHERPDETFASDYFGGQKEDYDVLKHNSGEIVNGTNADYNQMFTIANAGLSTSTQYQLLQQYLDVPNFIDYMITNFYVGNEDWAHQNWYATRNVNDPAGRWRYHSWDAEHVLKDNAYNSTTKDDNGGPSRLHQKLSANAEYRMLFADHVHRYFFNDGLLTPDSAKALYQRRLDEIDRAVVGESARWGDNRRSTDPYTRDDEWVAERDRLLNSYFPQRTDTVLNQLRGRGLYPSVTAPSFNQHGGEVPAGFGLTISAPAGTIYYALDGTDPRLYGGGISPDALVYPGGSIPISDYACAKARVYSGGTWSALNEAEFFVGPGATAENLVLSELNYNPYDPTPVELGVNPLLNNDDFEFVELYNRSLTTIDLNAVRFSHGIAFDFTGSSVTTLGPHESVVVVKNLQAFEARYGTGIAVAGVYEGNLDNTGERTILLGRFDELIADFTYNDRGNWPGRADGTGASLELIDPDAVPQDGPGRTAYLEDGDHWRSSSEYGGTPGSPGSGPLGDVVINEVLSHTDPPLTDTIELHNTTGTAIDVGGWYLSDTASTLMKFRIPDGTTLPAAGYVVFDEDDFNPTPLTPGPNDFALDGAHGDDVWLMEADTLGNLTRFVDHVDFGAAVNGESFGRWPNAIGDLYPMQTRTLDPAIGENSGPRVGPVIISEIQYNPGDFVGADDLEFVEIYNPTDQTVDLTDWRIRKGIDFDFADGTTLAPEAVLVVVPFRPSELDKLAAFRAYYHIDATVAIVGGYSGQMDDLDANEGTERVQLQAPDQPPPDDPDYIPRLLEDEARYDDQGLWPAEADGQGQSLHRIGNDRWGNDPASWAAFLPTPGTVAMAKAAEVVGRYVFYNRSAFDGNSIAANAQDDNAIATDKQALLPGQTATFANYTSFSRGINGIMIDIDSLPAFASLGDDDFEFRVGNSSDPSTWAAAPAPTVIAVRAGDGVDGSDRVTILWSDYSVVKQWLQVTVLANGHTLLEENDVFYFGSAVGEAGNSTIDAKVNASDMLLARNNPRNFLNPASVEFDYDFNRDARVNATDMLIARNNQTHFLNALKLISAPGGKAGDAKAATPLEKAATLDAVLLEAAETASPRAQQAMAWLYELEEAAAARGKSDKASATENAIDWLLTTGPQAVRNPK